MKTSIALIGYMGTGKTAVGRVLAERLRKQFVEMDTLIEHKAGKSIPEIFRQSGEIGFRELEIEVARDVAGMKNAVIACGGGVVLNRINVDRLKNDSAIVYLTASPRVILKRTLNDRNERPLLEVEDRLGKIHEMLRFRKPMYERAADITVNTSRLSLEAVADEVIKKVRENEGLAFEK